MGEWFQEQGLGNGFSMLDPEKMGLDDDKITNTLDVSEWAELKGESLNKHRTQMNPEIAFR